MLELEDRGPSYPLVKELDNGVYIGQFYNSWDNKFHLAKFIPCKLPPVQHLCGYKPANLTPSRSRNYSINRPKCEKCFELAEKYLNNHTIEQNYKNKSPLSEKRCYLELLTL